MGPFPRRLALIAAVLALVATSCSDAPSSCPAPNAPARSEPPPPAPERVELVTVPLADDVARPVNPYYTADGEWLLFNFTAATHGGDHLAIAREDGSGFRCLTCPLGDAVDVGKVLPFPDGRRVLVVTPGMESPPDVQRRFSVVECTPSLADCAAVAIVPIAGMDGGGGVQEREARLSPDGQKLLWTKVRPDGFLMLLADLSREGDHYAARDARVVNPPFARDGSARAFELAGSWYEAKAIADGGTTLVYGATHVPGANVDGFALDLATGSIVGRLSAYPDWNEGHQISPDGRWIALGSARGRELLEPLVRVPLPAFLGSVKLIAAGRHLLSRAVRDTEREALEPWLLDRAGDRGDYIGQQLNLPLEPGWDGRNLQSWHPSGTRLVFWESLAADRREPGRPSARLRIARLPDRTPASPLPIVETPLPAWAPRLADTPVVSLATALTVPGAIAGAAHLELPETMFAGTFHIDLAGYSDDGRTVLDGFEEMSGSVAGPQSYRADVRLSSCSSGFLRASVEFSGASAIGSIESDIDGVRLRRVFCGTAAEKCD